MYLDNSKSCNTPMEPGQFNNDNPLPKITKYRQAVEH